jgi:diguanylate cyclase (GGDEF)-like protein
MSEGRVLVADDDATVRLLANAALARHGFVVQCVDNGTAAWEALDEKSFDLVMLDVEMPGHDGFSLCRKIRDELKLDIPVLLVTGHDDVDSIQHAYDVGATDFIAKPINWSLLGHRLRYVVRNYRVLQSLDLAKARHRAMLRAFPDALLRINTQGTLVEQHGQQTAAEAVEHTPLQDLFPKDIAERWLEAVKESIATGNVQQIEYALTAGDDRQRVYEGKIAPVSHEEAVCVVRDVSERREADRKILNLAFFDPLTGLPNRSSFQELLKSATHLAQRNSTRLAVLFLDIDGFKAVNDTFGHNTGDHVLQAVAERLRSTLRLSDVMGRLQEGDATDQPSLSRLGGDEFTVVLPNIERAEQAMAAAKRVCAAFEAPFHVDGQELTLSTSVGISLYPDDANTPALLVKHADTAMYAAKARGRAQAQFYSHALTDRATQRFKLEASLRLALQREELRVFYQPIIDVAQRRVIGFEALVRWRHPELGLLPPSEFIPVAEECGLISRLGQEVLRVACADAAVWNKHSASGVGVAVNLSASQLDENGFVADVNDALRAANLSPQLLELEITESAIVNRTPSTVSNLEKLRAMGVRIALDDFGTGFSSLAYLREMPLSTIKIDRSFVEKLPDAEKDVAIVRSIIALGKNLGLRVIGEGIETQPQQATIVKLGCTTLQGYRFSRPIPFEQTLGLLEDITWLAP